MKVFSVTWETRNQISSGYDTYDSFVVVTTTEHDARMTHPNGLLLYTSAPHLRRDCADLDELDNHLLNRWHYVICFFNIITTTIYTRTYS